MPDELTASTSPPGPRPAAAPLSPPASGRRFRPAALLVALLVLLTGAAVGGGMFALEQAALTWRPHAAPTAAGWHITSPHGQHFRYVALSGDRLAWVCGPYTGIFDLASGKSRLLGIARHAGEGARPAVSSQYTAWLGETPGNADSPSIWTYRFATSARRRLESTPGVVSAPALSGATLVWAGHAGTTGTGSAATAITVRDLSGGVDRIVARGASLSGPVLVDAARVGWGETAGATSLSSPYYDVKDLVGGQLHRVDLLAGMAAAELTNMALSGNVLVWRLQAADGSGEILVHDIGGGTTQPIAAGPGLSGGSIDGDLVVWSQPAAGGGTSIMGRRLSAPSPFVVATVSGDVRDVVAGGASVAWIVDGGQGVYSGIETTRLLQ